MIVADIGHIGDGLHMWSSVAIGRSMRRSMQMTLRGRIEPLG